MVPEMEGRRDGVPVDRRADAAAAARGVDAPLGTACGGVFPHAGRVLC